MTSLHLDFETRSAVDLRRAGVYVYAQHETTDAWCAAHAVDEEPIKLWTPDGDEGDVRYAMKHCDKIVAHNAAFERIINQHMMAKRYGWPVPHITQWRCTMAMALAMSLPGSLENAAAAVGLEARKDMDGHGLMMRMAKPRRPRKGENPNGVYYFDDEDRKQKLYDYCRNDVRVERELEKRLLPLRPDEQRLWWLDQTINDRGVFVDTDLCNAALKIVETASGWLDDEMRKITKGHVSKCSNVGEITAWLYEKGLTDVTSIAKGEIDELLAGELPDDVRKVLTLRREAAKASVAKIDALLAGRNGDGRARGLLQFHAASTGRWAGRRFQPHNIKRPDLEEDQIDDAIQAVATGDAEHVRLLYGEPLSVVGDCLRGMVRAAPGAKIIAADFSNIEGRIAAWYGGEEWKLDAFRAFDAGTGPDIYLVTAASIYGVPVSSLNKRSPERAPGKVCELAFGFQGGVAAWRKFEASAPEMPKFSDPQVDEFKDAWREKHAGIQSYWYDLENAAKSAVVNRGKVVHCGRIQFRVVGSFMFMRLPSGRAISYPYPCIKDKRTPWGAMKPTFSYKGVDAYTRKWGDQYAHGGLLFNNVVQGTARDIEAEAMIRVERAGYPVVLTVHDEVVAEPALAHGSDEEFEKLMIEVPAWAEGLPIAAGAWSAERYRK